MVTRKIQRPQLEPTPQATAPEPQTARSYEPGSNWMIPLLDLQTVWLQSVERNMVDFMTPWFKVGLPMSAQPIFDAAQAPSLGTWPWDMRQIWDAWGQVWINALQHDVQNAEDTVRRF